SPAKGGARALRKRRPVVPVEELPALDGLADPARYLAAHSRSFRFAATLMAAADRARVARVYAWCRYVDNLVDAGVSAELAERRLDTWLACSRAAYDGRDCGVELVNRVMGEMAEREIPFAYAHDLVRAMRSDLYFSPYPDLDALRVYTYRAAGVVGRWLTELHGVHDAWMLDRATALGRAMQLTNILRDVGEDLERGRMYLPTRELARRGLAAGDIDAVRCGTREIDAAYRDLTESLIEVADEDYRFADEGLPHLPRAFRRAASVASAVYRGIHAAIRRNGYDNVRRRAYTTQREKLALAAGALFALARPCGPRGARVRVAR
ncbi:MAG TPA: phytoene/squalene synthase family protein, partial [Gemmatimonadaceae bacterium]|nr:phytoene/squalene synthase family protein [Gemmatimonadaceae bacterium]